MKLRDRLRAAVRAYTLGTANVTNALAAWGVESSEWAPAEYGAYLATSNAVYTCATYRAQALSSLPIKIYKGDKEVTAGGPGTIYDLLHSVNPFWTFSRLVEMTELSLCIWGSAYWFLERNVPTQPPREAYWAQPGKVRVYPHPQNYVARFVYDSGVGNPLPYEPRNTVWLRYPNPLDEYSGLSPLAAARLAADMGNAAQKSNLGIFANGLNLGGVVQPIDDEWSPNQAAELDVLLDRKFRGTDKKHRWVTMKVPAKFEQLGVTPKDAEYLGALAWSLEEVCRAYKIPLDLVGGQRTYDNTQAAERAFWARCIVPEAKFIADELNEQLLAQFPGQADRVEFDTSSIEALQEGEDAEWTRAAGQILAGAITVNEWRVEQGLKAVPWGDVWWAPAGVAPHEDASVPEPVAPPAPVIVAKSEPTQDVLSDEDLLRFLRALKLPAKVVISDADIEEAFRRWDKVLPEYKGLLSARKAKRDYGDDTPWVYEANTRRYRNTDTGRFVGAEGMQELRGDFAQAQRAQVVDHARALSAGEVDAAAWEAKMRDTVRTTYVDQYVAGHGGRGSMTPSDWGKVGSMTREQYKYLGAFAGQVEGMSEAQIAARAQLYVASSNQAYEVGVQRGMGMPDLPAQPGDGDSECMSNCHCHWEITETDDGWDCRWVLGEAEHCPTCEERAGEWNPLHVAKE